MPKALKNKHTLLILILLLSACSNAAEERLTDLDRQATAAVLAQTLVAQPVGDATQVSEFTPSERSGGDSQAGGNFGNSNTSLENVIFREDFETSLRAEWFWVNEDSDNWTLTDQGSLQFLSSDNHSHFLLSQNNLLELGQPTGIFSVETHVTVEKNSESQKAGIFVLGNEGNFIELTRSYCTERNCPTGENVIVMEYKINGIWWFLAVPVEQPDVELKLLFSSREITSYYALVPGEWIKLYTLNKFYDFDRVGLAATISAANSGEQVVLAEFDYFEVRQR